MGWKYLSVPKLQRCSRWGLGMDKSFHPTHYDGWNYLSMLGLRLIHVSKGGHKCWINTWTNVFQYPPPNKALLWHTPKEPLSDPDVMFPDVSTRDDITFTTEDVEKAISEISASAAAGPDHFPALLLKQCKHVLSQLLYLIWRSSLDTGEVPQLLRTANIISVHKGNSRRIPKNYRPIALTSHLIKLFEKVLPRSIVDYMERHDLFNPSQHGFRHGRSCLSQLIAHYDHILELMEMVTVLMWYIWTLQKRSTKSTSW